MRGLSIGFVFLALVCASSAQAQSNGKITGTVSDSLSGEKIINVNVRLVGTNFGASTDWDGDYTILNIPPGVYQIEFSDMGYQTRTIDSVKVYANLTTRLDIKLLNLTNTEPDKYLEMRMELKEDMVIQKGISLKAVRTSAGSKMIIEEPFLPPTPGFPEAPPPFNTEEYDRIYENEFLEVTKTPLSTFSIDVDAASYTNCRRFLNVGQLPPPDAVRIEEFINYFSYDYPDPTDKHPFSITTELAACPWSPDHKLLHIGLQGKRIKTDRLPPCNLTFLLDVSGSMVPVNKLPLLKTAFRFLTEQLRREDQVAIVVYAGATGLVLPSTPGDKKEIILSSLDRLEAGGTTAGAAGMELAYKTAKENFQKGGNNRVIWATDGDFNTGVSSTSEMVRMIEERRQEGIFLTMIGVGEGNLKDSRMEQIADKGNGQYYYLDNIAEARRVMISELGATLLTIAKDVKLQIEFNPAKVKAYRLIGYENRLMRAEEFHDDTKDAGEIGAGHSVTALYELIPTGVQADLPKVDDLKYQTSNINPTAFETNEALTLKLRYKQPDKDKSELLTQPVIEQTKTFDEASVNFRFSAAVAAFGMMLRNSKFIGSADFVQILNWAKSAKGEDGEGYRTEFCRMIETAELLKYQGHR